MQFPRFTIRDMVSSQHRLLTEHLGVKHVVAVVGASMGGMQALQWGVSHPGLLDSSSPWCRWLRTPAWTVTVLEASRKAIMLDPAWNGGNYTSPPAAGIRLWRDILGLPGRAHAGDAPRPVPRRARRAALAQGAGGRAHPRVRRQ